jgi:hypothetical protein
VRQRVPQAAFAQLRCCLAQKIGKKGLIFA